MAEIPAGITNALEAYERAMSEWVYTAAGDSNGFGGGRAAGQRTIGARRHLHEVIKRHLEKDS